MTTALVAVVLRVLPAVSPTTVALSLLLLVLASATAASLWVSIVLSIVAMLSFNFFFLPPVGTLRIADVQNWVALFVFLAVAVSASQLSAVAKARAAEAAARESQLASERAETEFARRRANLASALLASIAHDVRTPLTAVGVRSDERTGQRLRRRSAGPCRCSTRRAESAVAHPGGRPGDGQDRWPMPIPIDRQWVTPSDVVDAAVAHVGRALDDRAVPRGRDRCAAGVCGSSADVARCELRARQRDAGTRRRERK